MDLDDYHNNFYAGIHAANMAGTWQAIVNGFAGIPRLTHHEPVVKRVYLPGLVIGEIHIVDNLLPELHFLRRNPCGEYGGHMAGHRERLRRAALPAFQAAVLSVPSGGLGELHV